MSNQQAIQTLIGLWNRWPREWEGETDDGERIRVERGFGAFKELFRHLADVRHWGAKDRVQDTFLPWLDHIQLQPDQPVQFEVELWYRSGGERLAAAESAVRSLVEAVDGRLISSSAIPEIRYHGLLLEAPSQAVLDLARQITEDDHGDLVRCEDVMFFRGHPQSVGSISPDAGEIGFVLRGDAEVSDVPTVALLDGLPLERHEALDGHLIIDDPDDIGRQYRPGQQCHGTAMASLIVHGDLEVDPVQTLSRKVYTRPVLQPEEVRPGHFVERFPIDRLFVDVVHRAVRRIIAGDGEGDPVAPSVKIVNLSIGNPWQKFDRNMSPLAKLLDWLAFKYRLLFIVAAGNQSQSIELDSDLMNEADADAMATEVLRAMGGDQSQRRLFSPAESVNSVSIGATHEDACTETLGVAEDPLGGIVSASPLNTVAGGFRRSVKPEILMPGGRQLYNRRVGTENGLAEYDVAPTKVKPGHRVSAPGGATGDLSRYWYERGTSNATALATRSAAIILERLLEIRDQPGGDGLRDDLLHVATKALLIHGAAWGELRIHITPLAPEGAGWQGERRLIARFLGYGRGNLERSVVANDKRVLLLATNQIADGQGHIYSLPLPPSLSGQTLRRRLTTTLAWMTPINTLHRDYRRAAMFLDIPAEAGFSSTLEVHEQLATVGTVQHLIYETERAVPIGNDAALNLKVNCRAAAGRLDDEIPYALAVTLEVTDPIETSIYNEIRDAIRARARVR